MVAVGAEGPRQPKVTDLDLQPPSQKTAALLTMHQRTNTASANKHMLLAKRSIIHLTTVYVHTYIHTYVYVYVHTYIHTYVYVHTYVRIRIRTYIRICTYIRTVHST